MMFHKSLFEQEQKKLNRILWNDPIKLFGHVTSIKFFLTRQENMIDLKCIFKIAFSFLLVVHVDA